MQILESGPIEAFAGFFDVQFKGSPENPASFEVLLSTAPDPQGSTHWGQQVFQLYPYIHAQPGDRISGDIHIARKKENHRLMQVCHLAAWPLLPSNVAHSSSNPCRVGIAVTSLTVSWILFHGMLLSADRLRPCQVVTFQPGHAAPRHCI